MIFAHSSLGVLSAYIIDKTRNCTRTTLFIWIAGILGSVAPDIDILYVVLIDPTSSHRGFFTHSLPLYFLGFLWAYIYIRLSKLPNYFEKAALAFSLGTVFHIVSDAIVDYVYPVKPFVNFAYTFRLFPLYKDQGIFSYITSPYMLLELIIIAIGLAILIKNFRKCKKNFRVLLTLLGIIEIGVFIGLIPFLYEFN